jgi:hypothetical protein
MLESSIERKFVRWCKSQGLIALKLNPNWYRNIPDRIIVFPGNPGAAIFLELKRPGEEPRPGQVKRLRQLKKLGYNAYHADTLNKAKAIVEEYYVRNRE